MKLGDVDVLEEIFNLGEGRVACQLIEFCDFPQKLEFRSLLNNYPQENKPPESKYSLGHS